MDQSLLSLYAFILSRNSRFLLNPNFYYIFQNNLILILPKPNESKFYVLLTVHPRTISQISPTKCTTRFVCSFISLLYMFRASKCPSSSVENCCIYATLIFVTLYGWRLVCWLDWSRPDATHTQWQISVSHRYSNFLLMMGTWISETCKEEK